MRGKAGSHEARDVSIDSGMYCCASLTTMVLSCGPPGHQDVEVWRGSDVLDGGETAWKLEESW